jgi:hypothetical protein
VWRIVDLGVRAPLCLATGVGLWRRQAVAVRVAYGVTSFLTLQAAAVLAMATVMLWRHDPTATPEFALALIPIFGLLVVLTARLLGTQPRTRPGERTTTPAFPAPP